MLSNDGERRDVHEQRVPARVNVAVPLRQEIYVVADEATCTRQRLTDAVRCLACKTPGAGETRLHMRFAGAMIRRTRVVRNADVESGL